MITECRATFGEPYIRIAGRAHFFGGFFHVAGCEELTFFDIHNFSGAACCLENIRLAAEERGNLEHIDIRGGGDCLFGGESVARYATEIHHETVFIDPELDGEATRLRTERDLARATLEGQVDVALRESLRLVSLIGTPADDAAARPFAVLAPIAAEHTPFGAADGILAIAAAKRLMEAGVLRAPAAYALAISAVAEEARARGARPRPTPFSARLEQDRGPFLADLVEERRTDALARVLGLPAEERQGITTAWLVPFASLKLWDRGLALPRVLAAATLAAGNDDKLRESLALGAASVLAAGAIIGGGWGEAARAGLDVSSAT